MADINNVGKFGKNSGVDLNSIKGGLKKDAMKTEEQKSIFEAVDADKNGILDDKEVQSFKENLDTSKDGVITAKEAKKFLKSLNLNDVDKKELLKFLLDYQLNTNEVEEVRIKEENGQKLIEVVYKNGTTEIVNHDKSSVVTSPPDENGNVTTSYLTPDKKLTKTLVKNTQGDLIETEYLEDGETPASSVTTTKSGSVSTVTYEEGKPAAKQVKHGSVTSNYSYAEDGSEVLNSKIENEGVPAKERRTEYSYDEKGVVTANITEFGKTTVQTIVDNNVVSETITEEGKTTVRTHNEDGTLTEVITTADGSETTVYNSEDKKLSKTKVVDGQEYTIKYDGEGNTVGIIVQNGESPALIAKRFGCDESELLELNKAQVKGKGKGRYFLVASEIKIPGEIEPDAKALQSRQTKEEATAAYEVTAQEIKARKEAEAKAEAERVAAENKAKADKENLALQKESAKQIYDDLMEAIDGFNDDDDIYKALKKIDDPTEMAEVERLLQAKGYKADNYYSAVEKFMQNELGDSKSYDKSFDEMEELVKTWINKGALSGDAAINAQARLAARLIIDGCDGFGTDVDEAKEGVRLIKSPKLTGDSAVDRANAKKVYDQVEKIIKKHKSFGASFKGLKDYLKGDVTESEIKYLDGILAQTNAIQGKEKAEAVNTLIKEAVEGGGTDIEELKQALLAINSPEDRKNIEAKLKKYCEEKGIKPQIKGQDYLQAILYDECDTFFGVSTDHNEIRKFNEMMIEQGAYTEEEAQKLRAETAALQMLDGGLDNIQAAAATIKDAATYAKLDALLKTKKYTGVEGFINKKFSSQVSRDKAMAIFAANNLLSNDTAANIAIRLLQNSDYDTKALGIISIRNGEVAAAVNDALKQKGSSLESVLAEFNKEKAEYKAKASFFDGLAAFNFGLIAPLLEHISDEYRTNTDMSDSLYLESDNPINLTKEQIAAYEMTVKTLEDGLAQMKADYQAALDSQGVVSGAVNAFCSVYNIGTTRDEIEARIEHEEETVRLLKLASQGKLSKIENGKTSSVTFEEVFTERQSAVVSANGMSLEAISSVTKKNQVNFDVAKVEKIANKAQTIVAMDYAKDNIAICWSELDKGLKTNNNKDLSVAISDTLQKLSEMSGKALDLSAYGYQLKDGVIVDSSGKPVPASELKEIATQLKQGLSDVSSSLLGTKIPANSSYDDVVDLLEDGYEEKMEDFKQEYRDAFGQEATDEMIENYLSTINTGKMVVNIVGAIGAVVAAPFTGGGSLAVFVAAAGVSLGLNALEKSTDADGYTNSEWTSDAEQALWDGALAAIGFKVGAGADKLVTQGFKEGSNLARIADSLVSKNRALIQKFGPNLSKETVEKATIWLSRAEATFGEVSSDTVQSIVQSYCMEGELNMESFLSGMVMSVAGNTAGHAFSAFGDVKALKNGADIDPPAQRRAPVNGDGSIDVDPHASVTNPNGVIDNVIDNAEDAVSPNNISGGVIDTGNPEVQSSNFARSNKVDVDESIVDGYRDGGRNQTFDLEGNIIDSDREIIVVDRTKDKKLQSIISDFKAKTNGMSDKQKAAYLQAYIHDMIGDGSVANNNLKAWEPDKAGTDVLLGDIVTNNPPIAVCRHRSLLYKILGDEVGLKVELQRGNFSDGTPEGTGGHAWNTVRFEDGSSAIFDAMHNKTTVTTPGQVDDYAKNYFTVDDTPLYNDGLTPLQTPKAQADASVSAVPRDVSTHNPEINPSANGIHSAMDSMSEAEIPSELKASWDNCKTKFRETVDLLEDLQPKAAALKARELATELYTVGKELTGIAKVKFNALMDKIENYFKTHNLSEVFADVKAKVNSATDAVVQSKAYKKSAEVLKDAYANIKAKDIPAKLKKVWEECGTHFDDLVKYVSSRDYSKAQSIAKNLLVKLKHVSVSAGVALKAKLSKLIDDVGNWLKNSFSVSDLEAKAGFEFSPDAPRSSHSSIDMSSPKAHTNSILSSKNKDVQTDFLTGLKNEDGTPRFTPEQIKQIVNENPNGIVDSSVLYGLFKDVKTPEEFTNALDTLNAISSPSELKFVKLMLGLESVEIKTDGTFAFAGKNTNIDSLTLEEFLDVRRNSKLPEEDFDNYLKEFLTNPVYAKALVNDGGNISKVAIDAFAHFDNPYQLGAVHQFVTSAATIDNFKFVPNWDSLCSSVRSVEDVTTIGKFLKSSRIDDETDFKYILEIYTNEFHRISPENRGFAREFLSALADTNFKATYCDDLFRTFRFNQSEVPLQKDLILKYLANEDFDRLNFVFQHCHDISPTSTNPLLRHVARTGEVPFDADNINSVIDSGLTPGFKFSYNQTQIRAIEHIIENYPNGRFEVLGFREILENVKTEQDFNNLTKLLKYENLDTFTLLQALKEGITDPKKIELLVKNTSNFDKALVKDLKTNYKLKSETCEKLAKLQTVSPTRYQKIVDSGLLDLIRDGKVSESILENVSATTFLSNRTLKDVRRMANGEPLIPTIPKSEIEAISRHVANGDVCEVDGALFVNHNGKPVRLQITKEKFEELFPPLSSVSFAQGSVGDCWLISTLDNLMDLPGGRVQLYSMLRQEGDDIFVTFPGTGKSIKFANGDIAGAGTYLNNSHIANAPKGLQLIEQAYAVHRIKNSANLYADGEITDIQEILKSTDVETLMKRLKSGTTTEAMTAISGVSNSRYFNIGSSPGEKRKALEKIQQVANRDDILISFSTHSNRLLGRAESTMSRKFDMVRSHAYSLKGYNPETGMVYITNPWHSQVVTEVPIHDFMKYADGFTITRLDGTPVRFDGDGMLEDVVSSSNVDVNMGTVEVEAPVGGAFTDRLKRIFGGGSGNDVNAVMKNVTGSDGTPKYTKAQINDLLEKSQVPISDDVLSEFLNFPVTAEIDFEIKQQVIQQLKSPEDVQMLSSLMKIAQSGGKGVELNLAQIGDVIDLAKFNGKVSNPVEVFDKIDTLIRNGKMDFPDSRDALVTLTDFLQSDEHKSFLMKLLNSFEQHDYKSSFWNYGGKLNSISAPLTIKNLNSLIEKYPNSFTPKYDDFNLFGGPTEYGVTSILDTINYADDVATFQVVLMNDLCRSGASIDRIVDVMSSFRMIGDMANVKNAPDLVELMNRGASGRVIEFAALENQPASIIDNPALKYLEANNYKIDYDNTHDVLTLLSADLSTPQKIQAFNDLLAAKDLGLQSVEITNIVSAIKTDADLARLKSMIDNGKVDTFKFIQDTKPATIDVDVPTTPAVKPISPETVKTPQEIRLDEIKRLNATYGIDVNHSAGLVELKINNPKRFAKIEESGLLDLIRDGKVDVGILRRLDMSENMFISNRTLAEIRRMVNGEPLVPTIPKSEIEAISKHVANGNVCEIDGALYVNDNGRPVKLKISKEIFEKYFPPLSNVAFRQGDIGDCWFVSTLENLMDKPAGRVAIYKLFEQQGDDILVRFPGSQNAVLFNKGLLAYNGHGPAIQVADGYDAMSPSAQPYGVQVLEQAYAVHRLKNGSRAYDVNSDITDINRLNDTKALLQRLHAGYEKEALGDLLGSGDIEHTRNQAKMTQFIEERANDPNFVLEFGTKEKPGFKLESELDANYDLYSSHAYAIKGYNPETGMVYISNPWSTHTITEVPMYELTKHLDNMTCVDLRTVQRADVSTAAKTVSTGDQHEGILDIFKKKKPITTTGIVENLPPELRDLRARLLSSETPTTYDKAYFESWAQENGLDIRYTSNGTVAEFYDQGKRVRRITEDSTKPGMIYDDRISYYGGNGELVGGRLTYSWGKPLIYDVVDGNPTNMVTLDAAGNWVSKETGLKVNYNPITGMESGMLGAVNSGIGSFGNTGTSRMRQATIQQQKDELFAQIDEQMDSVSDRMRAIRRATESSHNAKIERLQTRQAELDIEYNDYNVQTRATIEQKRAQMQGLLDDIHDEKKLLEVLERQDRELEQQFLEYQSALGDLEKKLELFEASHGRDGGTIGELYNYADERQKRFIGAELSNNLTEKVIPENAPAYFYDADIAELFHTYNITAPQNKAKVVAELREKLAEITRKYEKNTTRLDTCRENISSLETQRSGISNEVVELEAQQSQRRVDYRAEKESIAQDIEDAKALKLSEIKTPEYEALKSQMDELRNLHKEVSQIETQLEELGNQIYSLKVSYQKAHGYGADVTTTPEYQQLEAQYNGLIDRLYETDPKAITDQPTVDVVKPEPETVVKSEVSISENVELKESEVPLEIPETVDDGSFGTLGDIVLDGVDDVKVTSSYTPEQVLSADDLDVISRMRDIDDSVKPAVIEAYNEIGTRMSKGQLPSRDMMRQVVDDLAKKHGVDAEELSDSINDAMEKLEGWKYLSRHRCFRLAAGSEVDLDLITAFRIDKGLVSKAQLDASKDVLAELETRLINGEIPSSEMLNSVAKDIAEKYDTTVNEVLPIVNGTISKSNIRRLAKYFDQSLDKNTKAMQDGLLPIDREIARLREANVQASQVEVVVEPPKQPETQPRQVQTQEHTSFADRFTRRQETSNVVRQEVQTPTQPQTQNNGIGSFGNAGIGSFGQVRSSMDTPVPTRKITEGEIYDEMDKILKRNKEVTGEIQRSYDVKLERLQTRQSELDVEFNDFNVQTRATIEQKRAQMNDLFRNSVEEKQLLKVLERQDRELEQQFLEFQSALGDLEKKLELFEASHGRDGGTIDELYEYAPERIRRTIGAEHTSNLTEKVIPENAPAYFYDSEIAELFHTYNITAPQNKAKVVAELREKFAEITRKYEKNTANLNACRNNIETMDAQYSNLSGEIVDLESSLTQRRTDYRTQKDAIANDIETTATAREQALADTKNSPELAQNSARFKELQRQLRGEIPMEEVPVQAQRTTVKHDSTGASRVDRSENNSGVGSFGNGLGSFSSRLNSPSFGTVSDATSMSRRLPTPKIPVPDGYNVAGTMRYRGVDCTYIKNSDGTTLVEFQGAWNKVLIL